jgi:hypothetical protein
MKLMLISILLFSINAQAEILNGKYELINSKINYVVSYLIKKADGESLSSKGKGECSARCEFLVAAPIKSFESKDSNRDANMLRTTNAEKYPLVVAKIQTQKEFTKGELIADLEIDFAGVKHIYKSVPFKAFFKDNSLHVEGKFDLILSEHKIEKPSLMGVEIKDLVPLTISAIWKKI